MQGLGFKALATSSSALAYTLGKTDGNVTLEEKLDHCHNLAHNVDIPINADFENGFADDPEEMIRNLQRVIDTGVAGCSIEDFSRKTQKIYDFDLAVERIQAAVEIIAKLDMPFQLTARAENLLHSINNLDDTLNRLKAFQTAGANVLYAPGINSLDKLQLFTSELSSPFNALAPFFENATVSDIENAGAKRISVGGALNWHVVSPLIIAGKEILSQGTFNWTKEMVSSVSVKRLFDAHCKPERKRS